MVRKINLEELKKIELDILDYVVSICEENSLIYFLDSGTLLGAVRHHGFIPWDDDIDIIMPRCDYIKLEKLIPQDGKYKILSMHNNSSYYYPFMKVVDSETMLNEYDVKPIDGLGVYIDVFPVDGFPNEEHNRMKFQKKVWFYRIAECYSVMRKKPCGLDKLFKYYLFKLIGWKSLLKKVEELATKYDCYETKYANCVVATSNKFRSVPSEIYQNKTKLVFEGKEYCVPKEYDYYLNLLYGNYMKLPPIEERVSNHNFEAYYK